MQVVLLGSFAGMGLNRSGLN